ncbi:hypothetical protein Tco_0503278 [Tanacetum coccineum]
MINRNDVRHRFMLCCSGNWKGGRVRASLASATSMSDKVVVLCQVEKAKEEILNKLYISEGRNSVWPHVSQKRWSYCVTNPSRTIIPSASASEAVSRQVVLKYSSLGDLDHDHDHDDKSLIHLCIDLTLCVDSMIFRDNVSWSKRSCDFGTAYDDERGEAHHNWVDEVVSSEARGAIIEHEEAESPKVLAQICIQRMWVPPNGLGLIVVSDMAYFVENPDIYYNYLKFELLNGMDGTGDQIRRKKEMVVDRLMLSKKYGTQHAVRQPF